MSPRTSRRLSFASMTNTRRKRRREYQNNSFQKSQRNAIEQIENQEQISWNVKIVVDSDATEGGEAVPGRSENAAAASRWSEDFNMAGPHGRIGTDKGNPP